MYIEFTGCSGSGKSTISERVIALLQNRGYRVLSLHTAHFSALGPRLEGIHHQTLQNLLLEAHGVRAYVTSRESRDFFHFSVRLLRRHAAPPLRELNLRRSLIRKLGIHALMTSAQNQGSVCVIDEGIVHSAHNLFVHAQSFPDDGNIEAFAARVPLPDIIVYVRAPSETAFARTLLRPRGWWPRRLGDSGLRSFIEHGYMVFDKLMANPRLAERTIVLDSGGGPPNQVDRLAEETVERVCVLAGYAPRSL